jgi:hypothetical protein
VRCKLKDNFMTKVRVSEETPNLSHSSNLISTIRLENPSPSLMRSIRARGRTHLRVVQTLWREQEREHFRAAREQPFLRARARIPRQQTSIEIEAARTALKAGCTIRIEGAVLYGLSRSYSKKSKHRNRGKVQSSRKGRTVWISNSIQQGKGHEFQDRKYSQYRTDSIRSVRLSFWHKIRAERSVLFSGSFGTFPKAVVQHFFLCFWAEAVGTNFKVVVQQFGGTEIEEQTCNLLQKILGRILRSWLIFLCEELARLSR